MDYQISGDGGKADNDKRVSEGQLFHFEGF
jgi:hypothetical protein